MDLNHVGRKGIDGIHLNDERETLKMVCSQT